MADLHLPAGYHRASVDEGVFDEAANHLQAVFMHESGRPFVSVEDYRNFLGAPFISHDDDIVFVRDSDGALVAQAVVMNRAPYVDPACFAAVSPEHYGNGVGTALITWEQARAEERLPDAPDGARVVLQAFSDSAHQPSAELLGDNGFAPDRFFLTMAIDFEGAPAAAIFPPNLELRQFTPDQTEGAVRAMRDAFRDHYGYVDRPFDEQLDQIRHGMEHADFDATLWWHLYDGEEIVANCWCHSNHEGDKTVGYVQSLGVRKPWRGRGLGKALLLNAFGEFHRRGLRGAALDVDADSLTGATRLYEAVGMSVSNRQTVYGKELRAGDDLAVRSV